jgi:hypothetical protein
MRRRARYPRRRRSSTAVTAKTQYGPQQATTSCASEGRAGARQLGYGHRQRARDGPAETPSRADVDERHVAFVQAALGSRARWARRVAALQVRLGASRTSAQRWRPRPEGEEEYGHASSARRYQTYVPSRRVSTSHASRSARAGARWYSDRGRGLLGELFAVFSPGPGDPTRSPGSDRVPIGRTGCRAF